MASKLISKVEVYTDGHREVYHESLNEHNEGYVWTHPDTKDEREACSACTSGTAATAREQARLMGP